MKIFNKLLLGLATLALPIYSCEDHVPSGGDPVEVPGPPEGIIFALAENNLLYELDVSNPSQPRQVIKIETQYPKEKVISIDFRPATGQLNALTDHGTLYAVNVNTNRISRPNPVNPAPQPAEKPAVLPYLPFDFDPVSDEIRLIAFGAIIRYESETFKIVEGSGRPASDQLLYVEEIAFGSNYSGAKSAALFGLDPTHDKLVRFNAEQVNTVETSLDLGKDITSVGGFDISPRTSKYKEYGFAAVQVDGRWELDVLDLSNGRSRKLGNLPDGDKFIGIAVPTPVAYALTADNHLISFNPTYGADKAPGLIVDKTITGLPANVKLLGLDFSVEVTPRLYALASNSKIYRINQVTGAATEKSTLSMPLELTNDPAFALDFDPVDNKLMVANTTKHAFKVDINTGQVSEFGALTAGDQPFGPSGIAFSNSQVGVPEGSAKLFAIDGETKKLHERIGRKECKEVGDLSTGFDKYNGFDIGGTPDEFGFALLTDQGKTTLWRMSLETGVSDPVTTIPYKIVGFTLGAYLNTITEI
ncbi:hypothetical protein GCM10007423_49450 [Dyadobacter endophyticus]|uniref:DUF4394 domain-containing protein n=1 Tax=Dyadobacter endophyticus TaxID=1749036 RepID=A0ABQ1Z658_9BACT|nr:DUF4394 domain-containing protein [Dyadobacter endophyticus]GGH48339.1 hypothetical protein GCM10007423_49450 [Dyadobacter endophyticus]